MTKPTALFWPVFLLCVLLSLAATNNSGAYELTVSVLDDVTGLPVPARVRVVDSADSLHYAVAKDSCWYQSDHATRGLGYCYTTSAGTAVFTVPTGSTVISTSRGPEYSPTSDILNVTVDIALDYTPQRFIDMPALGWYSGDNHTHIKHAPLDYTMRPDDAVVMAQAEGLNVLNALDNGWFFTGAEDPNSTATNKLWFSQEVRHRKWGHFDVLGTDALVDSSFYKTSWIPFLAHRAGAYRDASGYIVPAHPRSQRKLDELAGNTRARELPLLLWKGAYDALDVVSYSNSATVGREWPIWYHSLNAGFKVPGTAGTDAVVNENRGHNPPGGYRAYAYLDDTALSHAAWLTAMDAGKLFVTNGPLFTAFTLAWQTAGSTIAVSQYTTTTKSGTFTVEANTALTRAYLIVNGDVDQSWSFSGATAMTKAFTVTLEEPSWVSVKVMGVKADWQTSGDSLFAHTSPIYVSMGGLMAYEQSSADRFATWSDTLKTVLADEFLIGDDVADSTAAYARLDSCDTFYAALLGSRGIFTVGSGGDFGTLGGAIADAATGEGDTLVLLAGVHEAHFDSVALYDNMTLRGSTRDAAAHVIVNAAQDASAIDVSDATVLIQDITFSDHRNGDFTTHEKAMIEVDDDADVTVRRCRFMDIRGNTAPGLFAEGDAVGAEVITVTFEDCYAESCYADAAIGLAAGVAVIVDCNAVTVDGGTFVNNESAQDGGVFGFKSNFGHTNISGALFADNACDDLGAALNLNTRNDYDVTIDYCTFDGNTSATVAEGQIFVSQSAPTHTLSHSIITGGGTTYALASTSLFDVVEHVNSYGNGEDNLGWNSAAGDDTIHIDPNYSSTGTYAAPAYTARAKGCRDAADGSYMGWRHYMPDRGLLGGHRRSPSRRR